ncbi:MAG TPA: YlxR family protein [Chloroflexota bacterium]
MAKHIPERSCIACRETKPKRELVRVVRTPDGRVEVDRTGKQNGRGAYFCPAQECWELGQKRKALNHALSITVSPENWEELFAYARETLPEHKVPTRVPMQAARKGRAAKSSVASHR